MKDHWHRAGTLTTHAPQAALEAAIAEIVPPLDFQVIVTDEVERTPPHYQVELRREGFKANDGVEYAWRRISEQSIQIWPSDHHYAVRVAVN